jgi:hypothetical protein
MSVAARVQSCRLGSGTALAFLAIELGVMNGDEFRPFLKLNELVLREGREGLWLSYPSKQRVKNGQPVMKDGKAIYDEYYSPAFDDADGKYQPTEASYAFKNYLTKLAGEAYEAALTEGNGRGAPRAAVPAQRSAPTPRQAPAATARTAAPAAPRRPLVSRQTDSPALFGQGEDTADLPF